MTESGWANVRGWEKIALPSSHGLLSTRRAQDISSRIEDAEGAVLGRRQHRCAICRPDVSGSERCAVTYHWALRRKDPRVSVSSLDASTVAALSGEASKSYAGGDGQEVVADGPASAPRLCASSMLYTPCVTCR